MAKIIQEIEYRADTRKAESASRKLEKRMQEMFSRSAMQAVAFNKALEFGQRALSAVISLLKEGAAAALEWERTTVKLRTILEATGHEVDQNTIALEHQSDALEKLLGVSDETIRSAQAMGIAMGTSASKVDDLVRAGAALQQLVVSRGGGDIPLTMAMRMLTEVQVNGTVPAQLKVLDIFQKLTKEQIKNIDVVELLRKHYGDAFLIKTLETTTTNVDRLGNAWGNVWEEMWKIESGGLVDSVLGGMAGYFNDIAKTLASKGWQDYLMALRAGGVGGTLGGILGESLTGTPGSGPAGALTGPRGAEGGGGQNLFAEFGGTAERWKFGTIGKGKRPGGGGPSHEFDVEGFGADSVMLASGEMISEDDFAARSQRYQEGVQEQIDAVIAQGEKIQAIWAAEDEAWQTRQDVKVAAHSEALKKMEEDQKAFAAGLNRVMGTVASVVVGAFDEMARGEEAVFENMAAQFLKSLGIMVLQKGTADMAMAVASTVLPPYTGAAGLAPAAAEIALGALMAAGGAAVGGHVQSVRAGGSGHGGGSAYAAGSIGGGSSGGGGGGDQIINVNISGVMTSAEAGREIQRQINDARRQGLI